MGEDNGKKSYEVKDERRVNPDGTIREEVAASEPEQNTSQETQTPGSTQSQTQAQPESPEKPQEESATAEDRPVPSVFDLLQFVAGMIAEQAWLHMGLRLAPGQKEPKKDLLQAKLAVDSVVFIVDKVQPHVSEEDRRALRALVSDLQINFVKQSQ